MDKLHPPTNFGVFKPTHHTLIAFHTHEELRAARVALHALGFHGDDLVEYSAQEMLAQAESELQTASPLAIFGYELPLLRTHRELAERGCAFLVVHVPTEKQVQQVAELVGRWKPAAAQHYGRFLIEELAP